MDTAFDTKIEYSLATHSCHIVLIILVLKTFLKPLTNFKKLNIIYHYSFIFNTIFSGSGTVVAHWGGRALLERHVGSLPLGCQGRPFARRCWDLELTWKLLGSAGKAALRSQCTYYAWLGPGHFSRQSGIWLSAPPASQGLLCRRTPLRTKETVRDPGAWAGIHAYADLGSWLH